MMTTKRTRMLAIAVCSLFFVGTAFAQPGMGFGFFGDDGPGEGKGKRAEIRELLATVYLMELTKALELSKEQAIDVSLIIEKREKAKEAHQKVMHEALREMRHELGKDTPSEKKLKKWIAEVKSGRDKMKASESRTRDAIFAKLSITQQAKFIVFHGKWMRKLGRIKEHIRNEKMRKHRRGGPDGPMGDRPAGRKGMK